MSNGFGVPNISATTAGASTPIVTGGLIISEAMEVVLPPEVLLSPESLFAHLRSNLRDIDGQIRGQLELLQGRRDKIQAAIGVVNGLRADLSTAEGMGDDDKGDGGDGIVIDDGNRQQYIEQLVAGGMTQGDATEMVNGWGDHACVRELKNAVDAVNDCVSEMNGENEYQMLQVNELMSKRSNLIQLVSKILGNMNETAQSVIQNMR